MKRIVALLAVVSCETTAPSPDPTETESSDTSAMVTTSGPGDMSSSSGNVAPDAACASMCMNDIECDPEHEAWTLDECTMICILDLDTDGGPCKAEYVALWACVGTLSCEEYLDWVYGEAPWPCPEELASVDSCEGG